MKDSATEVYKQLHENQNQFVYLLLAIDVSSIGFAINRTVAIKLSWDEVLLGLSILCWAISFLYGCSYVEVKSKSFAANLKMFDQPDKTSFWKNYLNDIADKSVIKYKRLKNYLYLGVVLFIIWHLIQIIKLNVY